MDFLVTIAIFANKISRISVLPVIRPKHDVCMDNQAVSLARVASSLQARGLEVVFPEDLDAAFDRQMVQ